MPDKICRCPPESLRINPGKAVALVTINGKDVKNFVTLLEMKIVCNATQEGVVLYWISAGLGLGHRLKIITAVLIFSTTAQPRV